MLDDQRTLKRKCSAAALWKAAGVNKNSTTNLTQKRADTTADSLRHLRPPKTQLQQRNGAQTAAEQTDSSGPSDLQKLIHAIKAEHHRSKHRAAGGVSVLILVCQRPLEPWPDAGASRQQMTLPDAF
jgi:hypothetical protein